MAIVYRKLVWTSALLALCVVSLGAYVRLSDAGLGCPDWPGCYGRLTAPLDDVQHAAAAQAYPNAEIDRAKAWKEMLHRYLAGGLGLLILAIAITAWRLQQSPVLPVLLVAIVVVQALLGMWTVTLLLRPVVVTLHLLGGMTTLALLVWLGLQREMPLPQAAHALAPWAWLGLMVLSAQIALGGWVSANYAALVCEGFPHCRGSWLPPMDFAHGFHLVRDLDFSADGQLLSLDSLTAIHWVHRMGALLTFFYIGWLGHSVMQLPGLRALGSALLALLTLQVALGIGNVLMSRPLMLAVAHNLTAALLLCVLVTLIYSGQRTSARLH
ncbi:MAG: COX15/CtaA family protein [Burkholderiales bacterium]